MSGSSLVAYFWIGFAVCIFSVISTLILATIHESIIDNSSSNEVKEKKAELRNQEKKEKSKQNINQEAKDS